MMRQRLDVFAMHREISPSTTEGQPPLAWKVAADYHLPAMLPSHLGQQVEDDPAS